MKTHSILALSTMVVFSACATHYDKFEKKTQVGITAQELEARLVQVQAKFSYRTCQQVTEFLYESQIKCLASDSLGIYTGVINDGAYILGMGSSDVAFIIEIGPSSRVTSVRKDPYYTFL